QQNLRLHQPHAHKEQLKDQKPITQPQPVVQIIPKLKPQQAVYKQAPGVIIKDYVKQQQVASKQAVQKQAPRALPKDFVNQQQTARKSREKPAQPIKIVNKQQKCAGKRRRHYQIKSQQKQLEREFRDQEFNMEMMEQEQLQARFQKFESEPVSYDLLSQAIEDKRATFKDEQIEYAVIQRSEVIIDPNYVGRDLVEALYPGRTRYKPYNTTALSKSRTPMDVERNSVSNKQVTYRIRQSINEFKQYVRSSQIYMQERTEMMDTKELMVTIYSMEVISYSIPFPGKNMEELIKIHKNKKIIIKYIHSDDDYNIYFWYNLTCITMPDSKGIEIYRHSRIAEGNRLLFEFYNVKKDKQREFLKNYPGFNWED
ncbi:MAG: hypothetical protein EZS28_028078, partial [Streblomastix strix]